MGVGCLGWVAGYVAGGLPPRSPGLLVLLWWGCWVCWLVVLMGEVAEFEESPSPVRESLGVLPLTPFLGTRLRKWWSFG